MKNQPPDDTAQPALQRNPDEWKTGETRLHAAMSEASKTPAYPPD